MSDTVTPISGYILAGGHSSRMGREKALLELAGEPLIAHTLNKLRPICAMVSILSANPALATFAPLVPDLHPGCGPLGGIEAALIHATHDWSLILPVDVPFLPSSFLVSWVQSNLDPSNNQSRASIFTVGGVPNPTILLIHRDLKPQLTAAIGRRDFKLTPVLQAACRDLEQKHQHPPETLFRNIPLENSASHDLWFSNLNTPEDLAAAQMHAQTLKG